MIFRTFCRLRQILRAEASSPWLERNSRATELSSNQPFLLLKQGTAEAANVMWQASGPMMYDLLALLNGALCSTGSHVPLFIELLIQRGRESSTNPTAAPAPAMPRWGSQGNSCFPESQEDSVGCLKAEYLIGNNSHAEPSRYLERTQVHPALRVPGEECPGQGTITSRVPVS